MLFFAQNVSTGNILPHSQSESDHSHSIDFANFIENLTTFPNSPHNSFYFPENAIVASSNSCQNYRNSGVNTSYLAFDIKCLQGVSDFDLYNYTNEVLVSSVSTISGHDINKKRG